MVSIINTSIHLHPAFLVLIDSELESTGHKAGDTLHVTYFNNEAPNTYTPYLQCFIVQYACLVWIPALCFALNTAASPRAELGKCFTLIPRRAGAI